MGCRCVVLILHLLVASAIARSFNIIDYGAVPGGDRLCTSALQAAVAAAATAAPAEVLVPNGTFLSGSFGLASGVVLRLARGAVLLASVDVADYPAADFDWDPALIDTHNASDTGVVGEGEVNGQALPHWVDHYDPARGWVPKTWVGVHGCVGECRPKLLRFTDCVRVVVRGVALRNSPDWTSLYRRCEHVSVSNVTISGDNRWPNNDGEPPPFTPSQATWCSHLVCSQASTWRAARTSRCASCGSTWATTRSASRQVECRGVNTEV